MWISLRSLRQFVMGSAGMGSLVLGLPAVGADAPVFQNAILSPTPAEVMNSRTYQPSPSYPPAPITSQIMKPAYAVLPPPGTLGQTYHRQSWPVPKDEHPRTAIIQITAPGFTNFEVEGPADMESFQRPDGAWVFKSKQPLTPGVAHIYHVKAGYKNSANASGEVRTVRLIPGRVVTLEY